MGFRFPLASVLRVRENIEKREELALQLVQFEVSRVRRRIDELTAEMTRAGIDREESLQKWMQACQLRNWQDEMNAALEAKQILSETLQTLKSQRDTQMKVYQVARVDRRILTDLQQQQQNEWEKKQDRIDQKRLDDLFTTRLQRG
jgi:flagellar export protein FliJ